MTRRATSNNPAATPAVATRTAEPAPEVVDARLAAFDATAAARKALTELELVPYTLDAVFAASRATGTADRVRFLRDDMAQLLRFDVGHYDSLKDYAASLLHT